MSDLDLSGLRRFVAGLPAEPARTLALEKRIRIGTGFHNKWYSSQKEHWMGWLALKAREAELDGKTFAPSAIWGRTKCSPMLFWLAETAGAGSDVLDRLEQVTIDVAKVRPKDGNPHGVAFREILPWSEMQALLLRQSPRLETGEALAMGDDALRRLIGHLPKYRRFLPKS